MAKPQKTRLKKTALIIAAQDKNEAAAHIRRIGDLTRDVKRLAAEMGDKKAELEQYYREQAEPLEAEIKTLFDSVKAYCETNREELTDKRKTKTIDFVTGLAKWRIDPPSVRITGAAAVLAYMQGKTALARFIRTKSEINKEAILNESALFDDGQVPGIKIIKAVEQFVVEPTDPDLAGV